MLMSVTGNLKGQNYADTSVDRKAYACEIHEVSNGRIAQRDKLNMVKTEEIMIEGWLSNSD